MRILLVEDDELLGDGTTHGLEQNGIAVDWVRLGRDADAALRIHRYDVAILDIGLPDQSGLSVLHAIRDRGDATPVLVLTARDTSAEKVTALDMGADDYLVKPFDLDELCARIRALQRRSTGRATSVISHGNLTLDPAARIVSRNERPLHVSPTEFALLKMLLENAGRTVGRERLFSSLYGLNGGIESNSLDVHIHRLRRKLGETSIKTVRGIGYRID